MSVVIHTYGLTELVVELTTHAAVMDKRVRDALAKTVNDGARIAARLCRKDTHATEASIVASPHVEPIYGRGYRGEWFSGTHYDPHQEYGTSTGITPNFHHRRAFEAVAPRFDRAMEQIGGLGP
jgi:hypothetical protein